MYDSVCVVNVLLNLVSLILFIVRLVCLSVFCVVGIGL